MGLWSYRWWETMNVETPKIQSRIERQYLPLVSNELQKCECFCQVANFPHRKSRMIAPMIDRMRPAGKRRAWFRLGKQTSDQSADDRASDTEYRSHYETEMLRARHNRSCNQTDNEANNDVPNEV